ncbi:MAG TPA: AMP-binding protein [Sphingomicrobium sp.]|nr:AMP-binding protein [Sphingomicrobium sp.]
MDEVARGNSHFPAQTDLPVLETTVGGILKECARQAPDSTALIEALPTTGRGRHWTYGELLSDAERLAGALLSRFTPGERICVWAPNIPEWVILEYAAALAGLTLVTANPAFQERELRYVLEQSRASALFHVQEHRGNPMARIAKDAAQGNAQLREIIDLEQADALFASDRAGPPFPDVSASDPVQIQYTSGTTGLPKGAMISHRALTNNARFHFLLSGVEEGDTTLNFMPLFHTASCGLMVLGSAQFHCAMVLARLFDPAWMLDVIEQGSVNVLSAVPTMFVGLLEAQQERRRTLSSVRCAITGGATVPPELVRQVRERFGWELLTVYGQTECSPLLTQVRPDDPEELRDTSVGMPLPHTELSVRDPATNQLAPIGAVGEICARGYAVMIGYNDDPEATSRAIDADGWLHTGDLGILNSRGFLTVTGRLKDVIIRGGENLFPAEIESVILEHPSVAETAVVGLPDERWGEIVIAFIRLAPDFSFDERALVDHCRERLARPKIPVRWIVVTEWPLTGPGKIQKFSLKERLASGYYGDQQT